MNPSPLCRRDRACARWRRFALAGAVISAATLVPGAAVVGLSPPAGYTTDASLGLPSALATVVTSALGREDHVFAVVRGREGLVAAGGGLVTLFARLGPTITAGPGEQLSLTLAKTEVAARVPVVDENQVSYAYPGLVETFNNGPLGIDEQITVGARLAGRSGHVALVEQFGGTLHPVVAVGGLLFKSRTGAAVMRYGELSAVDASGRSFPAHLVPGLGRVTLAVPDRGARYPLRIDVFTQLGSKLTINGSGTGEFGTGVALSADGSTALVGVPDDHYDGGSAWVFTRLGSTWSQQGGELTPTDEIGMGEFGTSVALSGDGSTALIGGPDDNNDHGAAWVFTRSASAWAQQAELTGPLGGRGTDEFGTSVALSSNGATALVGDPGDNNGAAWVFTRSGTEWSQQGGKIKGAGEEGPGAFGTSVALSSNGSTAIVGDPITGGLIGDSTGAAWVFTRTEETWSQQGGMLTASDEAGPGEFGTSVALSSDGATALVDSPGDRGSAGAVWVFTRSRSAWAQLGAKLTSGPDGMGYFGQSVALSASGATALVGAGELAWVLTRTGATWDVNPAELVSPDNSALDDFGAAVALSAAGSTVLVGDPGDHNLVGAGWIFTRSGTSWPSRGERIGTSGESGQDQFGTSVALSSDGTTALVGGPYHDNYVGAVWVFTRTKRAWSQQAVLTSGVAEEQAEFGTSVALSADGDIALVGGPFDNGYDGATWVFSRSGSTWSNQSGKLSVAGGFDEPAEFGTSVALSGDGRTAIIGGPSDSLIAGEANAGAAWVFTRSGRAWEQQAELEVHNEGGGEAEFGTSVALSANGDIALIGGPDDTNNLVGPLTIYNTGAAWVFTRSDGRWSLRQKLTSGETGQPQFGTSVALSSSGATALVGGPDDDNNAGAAWVFVMSGATWARQGGKLTGAGEDGRGNFGTSVALSSYGDLALVGGSDDNNGDGAAWVFRRPGTTWVAVGGKLTGSDGSGPSNFGSSVALSGDGSAGFVGGPNDASTAGAAWAFVRSPPTAPSLPGERDST